MQLGSQMKRPAMTGSSSRGSNESFDAICTEPLTREVPLGVSVTDSVTDSPELRCVEFTVAARAGLVAPTREMSQEPAPRLVSASEVVTCAMGVTMPKLTIPVPGWSRQPGGAFVDPLSVML